MSDLIDDPRVGENAPEYSVSELSGAVRKSLESQFGRIRVKGEVGRVIRPASGHMYFDVKDDKSTLACTSWRGQIANLSVIPEEGMEVVVTGKMTAYGAQSKYNMNVDDVSVAGVGALMAMLEKRKKALAAEGVFDPSIKQQLPFLPEIIGVVTSPTGAVIRDILNRLRDRFARKVLVWPVTVQGTRCADEVTRAIQGFNALPKTGAVPRPDLIIVARGGGSIEDLWGFNEEKVARAAAASQIPLISAVGHETDTTLIDYAADRRAATPSAAAEMAVPVRQDLLYQVENYGQRMQERMAQINARYNERLQGIAHRLPQKSRLFTPMQQRLTLAQGRLPNAFVQRLQGHKIHLAGVSAAIKPESMRRIVQVGKARFENAQISPRLQGAQRRILDGANSSLARLDRMRETLGYKETLRRGYAVVRADEQVVMRKKNIPQGANVEIEFADGRVKLGASGAQRKAKPPKATPQQGDLF